MSFKVIIAGGRDYNDWETAQEKIVAILIGKLDVLVISGCCDTGVVTFTRPDGEKIYGADGIGEKYADEYGHKVAYFPAEWEKFGKRAGPLRNFHMAQVADALIAFWNGCSKGTADIIAQMKGRNKPIRIIHYN